MGARMAGFYEQMMLAKSAIYSPEACSNSLAIVETSYLIIFTFFKAFVTEVTHKSILE